MNTELIIEILTELGLKNAEISVYSFLAKNGPKKGKEILNALKISRQRAYRTLCNLQNKGFICSTLEHPARFSAISFDDVCNLAIKRKLDEVAALKRNQKELSSYLQSFGDKENTDTQPKIMIIQGEKKIFRKAIEMVSESKNEYLAITTVKDLYAYNFGLSDAINGHSSKSMLACKHLVYISSQDVPIMKLLQKGHVHRFEGRAIRSSIKSVSRLIIQDNKAVLFFLSSLSEQVTSDDEPVGLWTNSKALIVGFKSLFDFLWQNSVSVERKIVEIETGKVIAEPQVLTEPQLAREKLTAALVSAQKEIFIAFSEEYIWVIKQFRQYLRAAVKRGVKIRIIGSLSSEGIAIFRGISPDIELKIVDKEYSVTLMIDQTCLFALNGDSFEDRESTGFFDMLFCTTDSELIRRSRTFFDDLWAVASPT
ncbi:MAG: hypothetical protein M1540_03425 [Candidatus Bathyarchaeota archaeon]|nr:hypothetical protein [Candidatus Bathyarchaeota archaeon]